MMIGKEKRNEKVSFLRERVALFLEKSAFPFLLT